MVVCRGRFAPVSFLIPSLCFYMCKISIPLLLSFQPPFLSFFLPFYLFFLLFFTPSFPSSLLHSFPHFLLQSLLYSFFSRSLPSPFLSFFLPSHFTHQLPVLFRFLIFLRKGLIVFLLYIWKQYTAAGSQLGGGRRGRAPPPNTLTKDMSKNRGATHLHLD